MMTNTLTGLTLQRLNIHVATFASRMKRFGLSGSCATCSLDAVRSGPMHYPSRRLTGRVTSCVCRAGKRNSAVNNIVDYIVRKYPVKLNRPIFNGLRTTLNGTVLDVGTIGNFRCKRNFDRVRVGNDRRGSVFCHGKRGVTFHAGHSKNVRKNVDGKRSVCFHMTFGPMTAMLVRRPAISVCNGRAVLGTHKHRSPYILPHTIPVIRTVTTVAVLSCCLLGGAARLWVGVP